MRENRPRQEDLDCARTLKLILTLHGLSIDDTVLVPKLIKHVQDSHMNPAGVLSKLKTIDSLSSTISTLKKDITTSTNQLEDTHTKLTKAQTQIIANETEKNELEAMMKKLQSNIDEKALALVKLEEKSKRLTPETEFKEKEIKMADCLSGALLTNRPMDIDALFYCASELKKAQSLPQGLLFAHRKNYDPQVKEMLKKLCLAEFSNEFTTRKHHETVIKNWNNAVTESKLLKEQVENLKEQNTESKKPTTTLSNNQRTSKGNRSKRRVRWIHDGERNQDSYFVPTKPVLCTKCGTKNLGRAKYCIKCAHPLPAAV